ncbi:MAG TPA: hypothetical protein VFX28_12235, partial [Methylomirabilota bacterium]|nr:hypothetical protein [Methylomirabilota bacterium]
MTAPAPLLALRGWLLPALVAGLAASVSLAQAALAALAVWVLVARRRGLVAPLQWPLAAPLAAFAGWSVVAALASERPLESLAGARGLLDLAGLWVVLNALPDAGAARRFAAALLGALGLVAAAAIVQV